MISPKFYVVTYTSAVTGNHCSTSYRTLKEARKGKKDLEKDGAKNVRIIVKTDTLNLIFNLSRK